MPNSFEYHRSSGVLLPLPCLPGPFGIGDMGPMAARWLNSLAAADQEWWQVLPVGPTGFGDSPYQSPSTFAGNPNLISPEELKSDKLVSANDIAECELPNGPIDYTTVIKNKSELLKTAFERFQAGDAPELREPFRQFQQQEAAWLDDFALFAAIKERFDGSPWWLWPESLARGNPQAIAAISKELNQQIQTQRFGQFLFFRQWSGLRMHASKFGVRILGDLPIYVAEDSAEVWRHPELFLLDEKLRPTLVAGVPPDYFSKTGQLWGNPIYNWDVHRETGFRWWIGRMKAAQRLFDQVRIDHFRGIEAFWAVQAGAVSAERGRWLPGPGERLLQALVNELGTLSVVAEDLGFITVEVDVLRERFKLPGMRILQFAFGGAVEKRFLPHHFTRDLLVTTGTHDNNTTRGWHDNLTQAERQAYEEYVPDAERDPVWSLIRTAWASTAAQVIAPMQDLLELDGSARLNSPGTSSGNWRWRAAEAHVVDEAWIERLANYSRVYERVPLA